MTVKTAHSLEADRLEAAERKIHGIFRDALELDVEIDTDVLESGMLDSLAFVKLLVELEREFGIEVDLAELDLEDFGSVARIARLVIPGEDGTR